MKASVISWLIHALAIICIVFFFSSRARAGLAEATDFGATWTTGASSYNGGPNDHTYWTEQSSETLDGVDAVIGTLGAQWQDEITWMQTTVTGPTTLYYSYRVIWPPHPTFIDGSFSGPSLNLALGASGGDTGWRHAFTEVGSGERTLRWNLNYRKGALGVLAYVDQVFTSKDDRPRIPNVSVPASTLAEPFSWTVPVVSTSPATLIATGLPPGISVDAAAHTLSGTPTAPGLFEVTLTAVNGNGEFFSKHTINVSPTSISLPEALDAPTFDFTQEPNSGWHGAGGIGHDGVDCARAEDDTLSDTDTLSTTVIGPGNLSFWYRCEPLNPMQPWYTSFMQLQVGSSPNSVVPLGGGTGDWIPMTVPIPAGEQTISWHAIFEIGVGMKSIGPHYVYLDEMAFVPSPTFPMITKQPVSQSVSPGAPVFFSVEVAGTSPSLQWCKDGIDIPGAIENTLAIASAQPWQIGDYTVRVSNEFGSVVSTPASLGLTGVASGIWRGLVAFFPFDGNAEDMCRPGRPAAFINTSELVTDPQRGSVAHVQGKGFGIPPFSGEPVDQQGPGGYIRIPRPALRDGEPFTASFLIKEAGFSLWHGESFLTMGEGGSSVDLIGHYWIGSLDGTHENYGGNNVEALAADSPYVLSDGAVSLTAPWTSYTLVAAGNNIRLYRDGQFVGDVPWKKDTIGDFFVGRHWWADGTNYSTRLRASIDDLRIYNRELTVQEVQKLDRWTQFSPVFNVFDSWAASHGLTGGDAGLTADPEGDGLTNWDEFCFATSPEVATASSLETLFTGTTLTLTWFQRSAIPYRLMESTDLLAPWTENPTIPIVSADQSGVPTGYTRMSIILSLPAAAAGSPGAPMFFRVEAGVLP